MLSFTRSRSHRRSRFLDASDHPAPDIDDAVQDSIGEKFHIIAVSFRNVSLEFSFSAGKFGSENVNSGFNFFACANHVRSLPALRTGYYAH